MTATLSPVGTPIDMTVYEEHWDDELACWRCSAAATIRSIHVCCGKTASFKCAVCFQQELDIVGRYLLQGNECVCRACGMTFVFPRKPGDVLKAVDL